MLALLTLLVSGCTLSSPAASIGPSAAPSAGGSGNEAGSLPPGCEPINVRSPSGERIVLDGEWVAEEHANNLPQTWWIRTLGDCLWGAGVVEDPSDSPSPGRVQTLRGTIGDDFVVEGEIVQVATAEFLPFTVPVYSPLRMLIEFDENGAVVLHEDRESGAPGPRCSDTTFYCLPVLVLRPASGTAD
jgi:hypothetical protein